jgi:hypothetical protein
MSPIRDRDVVGVLYRVVHAEFGAAFEDEWREHLAFWETDDPGLTAETSVFARFVVRMAAAQSGAPSPAVHASLERVFREVEHVMNEGTEDAVELVVTGFLEGVQLVALRTGFDPELMAALLGPKSLAAWRRTVEPG